MAAPKSNNRRVTIILIVGGVVVALLAAFNLMSGGGGGGGEQRVERDPADHHRGERRRRGHEPTTTAPAAPTLPNGQFDVFATRNPFEPAVQVTPDTGEPSTGPPRTPVVGPTTPSDTTPPATGSPEPSAGTTVALIDVFDQGGVTMARVQVGSTVYTVAAGQTFATSYKVVSLSGTCGQFLFGDSPFSLCEGEQVIK